MRYDAGVGRDIKLTSGRVIALGRLLLACLFMVAILVDVSQPVRLPLVAYILLGFYVLFALGVVVATWRNWWLDAKLAGPAHAIDIIVFTPLVALTDGYTSPSFTIFIFVLLSAAIRWGWRETALSAILLTLLFLMTGMMAGATDSPFELQRFVIRTGHLVIVSLILIWFGVNLWSRREAAAAERSDPPPLPEHQHALASTIAAAMAQLGTGQAAFWWTSDGERHAGILAGGTSLAVDLTKTGDLPTMEEPFLYDIAERRGLERDGSRNLRMIEPEVRLGRSLIEAMGLSEGLAVPVRTAEGEGMIFFERIGDLSVDHLDRADRVVALVGEGLQRDSLLKAAEMQAEARSRLDLARDLHDSVVQVLAGAAFRLEAIKRSIAEGRAVDKDCEELKQLLLQEQEELRAFITALRSAPRVSLEELAADLKSLAARLAKQWDMECELTAKVAGGTVPSRLQIDAHHILREAVANAARHAGARSATIKLTTQGDMLRIDCINDGTRYPKSGEELEMPKSLRERVDQAGGEIDVSRGLGLTRLSIGLPMGNAR